jgi:hypothetical protein
MDIYFEGRVEVCFEEGFSGWVLMFMFMLMLMELCFMVMIL